MDNEAVNKLKPQIKINPFYRAVQDVLVEQKSKIDLSTKMMKDLEAQENDERLDTMLKAEGVAGPDDSLLRIQEAAGTDQYEYRQQLLKVRRELENETKAFDKHCKKWCEYVEDVLQQQGEFRPITQQSTEKFMNKMSGKFNKVCFVLKQTACEEVIQLKKRYLDARRKRRNFSKTSTEILNEYFLANINHPYPSEEVKQALAMQCNISVAQVSNWFGNKRIRYKKTMAKNEDERRENRKPEDRPPPGAPGAPYSLVPNAFAGMMNPYQMMLPGHQFPIGVAPFNFSMYNPEMMAQYQQSLQNPNQTR